MIAKAFQVRPVQRMSPLDLHAIFGFGDRNSHGSKISRHGGDAVCFFHPEFFGIANDCPSMSQCPGHGQDRKFIDDIRNFRAADDRALQLASQYPYFSQWFRSLWIEGCDFQMCAHALEDGEDAGAHEVPVD